MYQLTHNFTNNRYPKKATLQQSRYCCMELQSQTSKSHKIQVTHYFEKGEWLEIRFWDELLAVYKLKE